MMNSPSSSDDKKYTDREEARAAKFRQAALGHGGSSPPPTSTSRDGPGEVQLEATLVEEQPLEALVTTQPQNTRTFQHHEVDDNILLHAEIEANNKTKEKKARRLREKQERRKKQRCIIIVVLVAVVLIGAGAGTFFGLRSRNSTSASSNNALVNNGGSSPTSAPSQPPLPLNFPPPSKSDCQAIANNQTTFNNRGDQLSFNVELDLSIRLPVF